MDFEHGIQHSSEMFPENLSSIYLHDLCCTLDNSLSSSTILQFYNSTILPRLPRKPKDFARTSILV